MRVGKYTSPHLVDMRERIMVDGVPISREAVVEWTIRLRPLIDEHGISFFEATTAMAFADFAARGVDVAVVEVGLGGRLDSTNVLSPVASAVTHVALEHTEYLGSSLAEIAREKAGIAKPGVPLIVGEVDPALVAEIRTVAEAVGARVVPVPDGCEYDGALKLKGRHQRRNAAVARRVLEELPQAFGVRCEHIAAGFAAAELPGRFESRGKWIFDVAHNLNGFEALTETLSADVPPRPLHALVGILADKNWPAMVELLAKHVDRIYLTVPPDAPEGRKNYYSANERECDCEVIKELNFSEALLKVSAAATILVTGSVYTVGDAMRRLPGFAPLG